MTERKKHTYNDDTDYTERGGAIVSGSVFSHFLKLFIQLMLKGLNPKYIIREFKVIAKDFFAA